MTELMCHVCGTCFKPGNDPIDGTPNAIAVLLKDGSLFNICNYCVKYNMQEAIDMIDQRGGVV